MAKISIIIPVHNTKKYLSRSIHSVLNQTIADIEVVLVDNLSTDGSEVVCDEYASLDSRVKVLHLKEAGLSVARNAGLAIATAPYIGFIDSDDYILPEMFECLLNNAMENDAEMVYCNFCYEYPNGTITHLYPNSGIVALREPKNLIIDIFNERVSSSSCTKLYKRELFNHLKFPEGVFYEDHSTVYKWVKMCSKIVWVDTTFYYYYQREGSICHDTDLNKRYDHFLAEYNRLDFIKKEHNDLSFDLEEQYQLIAVILDHCLWIFKIFMKEKTHIDHLDQVNDMRYKLKEFCKYSAEIIGLKNYKKLRKIVYFWPLYYFWHFYKLRIKT